MWENIHNPTIHITKRRTSTIFNPADQDIITFVSNVAENTFNAQPRKHKTNNAENNTFATPSQHQIPEQSLIYTEKRMIWVSQCFPPELISTIGWMKNNNLIGWIIISIQIDQPINCESHNHIHFSTLSFSKSTENDKQLLLQLLRSWHLCAVKNHSIHSSDISS